MVGPLDRHKHTLFLHVPICQAGARLRLTTIGQSEVRAPAEATKVTIIFVNYSFFIYYIFLLKQEVRISIGG